jgi:hypothetical protein
MPKADVSEERIVISECGQRSTDWWNTSLVEQREAPALAAHTVFSLRTTATRFPIMTEESVAAFGYQSGNVANSCANTHHKPCGFVDLLSE